MVQVLAVTEGSAYACCKENSANGVRKAEVHFKVLSGISVG